LTAGILRSVMGKLLPFLADLVVSKPGSFPRLLILVTVPKMSVLEVEGKKLELPAMPFLMVLDLSMQGSGPVIERARVMMADKVIDSVLETVSTHLPDIDLRKLEPQLASFAEPISVKLKLGLDWENTALAKFSVTKPSVKLSLPE